MSDQIINSPPPVPSADVKPKRKWRWWQTVLAIVFVFAVVLKFSSHSGSVQLEVRGYNDGINVMNAGVKDITITGVTFNEHPGCSSGKKEPKTLKVGEEAIFLSRCQPTQVEIETDQGSETYSLHRR